MAKNSRRQNKAQPSASKARPSSEQQPKTKTKGPPQDEQTSSDDDWLDAEITQLPPKTPPRTLTAKEWITLEAQRLKRLDTIPVGIIKTEFAKILETNMKEAARTDSSISISPVGWRHISNHLQEWALWPVVDIE